jgi:uncharacterized membrane protein
MFFLLNIIDFIAHFHPVLVHLPIGILLIAAFFQLLSRKEKFQSLSVAVGIALFWGMISAIVSCISGFLLSRSDDYDESLISKHQWFGISVAVTSIIAYYLSQKNSTYTKWVMALMTLLIIITGPSRRLYYTWLRLSHKSIFFRQWKTLVKQKENHY